MCVIYQPSIYEVDRCILCAEISAAAIQFWVAAAFFICIFAGSCTPLQLPAEKAADCPLAASK